MPRAKRQKGLYHRGPYTLDWDCRADGSLRSPYLAVFWYDRERGGNRSASTRTADVEAGKRFLDALYLERTGGCAVCPTCQRPFDNHGGLLVADAVTTYQVLHGDKQESAGAIANRLAHVIDYIATLPNPAVTCDQVDERWISGFRAWAERQPIVSPTGKERARSLSTVENSVLQLAAAIRFAKLVPRFKAQPVKVLNRTPHHRSDIAELAAMFRYCVAPQADTDRWRERAIASRAALHRFLIISVVTLARPDAAYDVSTDPKRGQWISRARVLNLNPRGRRQTKKYRATVRVAWQVAHHLDATRGYFVGPKSIRTAWDAMAAELGLPREGEAGTKLIRRSMAHLLRSRGVPVEQLELMLGHRKIDSTSELYAPFDPGYMAEAVAEIEAIIDELETLVPGAFSRSKAGDGASVIPLRGLKNG